MWDGLSIINAKCHTQALCVERHYDECLMFSVSMLNVLCWASICWMSYAECHYAECRGTLLATRINCSLKEWWWWLHNNTQYNAGLYGYAECQLCWMWAALNFINSKCHAQALCVERHYDDCLMLSAMMLNVSYWVSLCWVSWRPFGLLHKLLSKRVMIVIA